MPAKNKYIGRKIGKTLVWLIYASNIFFLILLGLSMAVWKIPPQSITILSYLGLAFPIVLLLNIVYILFWLIFLKWKFALVDIIVMALCWNVISTYCPIHFRNQEVAEGSIKILTYNVKGFDWKKGNEARENPIFDYILSCDADIVCMQEFVASKKKDKNDIISEQEVNKIMKDYPYHSITRFIETMPNSLSIACYSKFPIERTVHIKSYTAFNGAILHELDIDGRRVTLFNCHLQTNGITKEDKRLYSDFLNKKDKEMLNDVAHNIVKRMDIAYKRRAVQSDTIANWIERQKKKTKNTIIVCGDFNDTPISYTYNKMRGDMLDAYAETGLGPGISYYEDMFWFRIDYIMHTRNIESYNCTVDKVKYSDHYPVWAYLKIR